MFTWLVVSSSLRTHGLKPIRLLCPWDFSDIAILFLQGIFLMQGLNLCLLHCWTNLYPCTTWEAYILAGRDWESCRLSDVTFVVKESWAGSGEPRWVGRTSAPLLSVRRGDLFDKVILSGHLKKRSRLHWWLRKRYPGWGNNKCKDPELGIQQHLQGVWSDSGGGD